MQQNQHLKMEHENNKKMKYNYNNRKQVKNKILYLPLAIIQWLFFTISLSGIGGIFVILFSICGFIEHSFMLDKEELKNDWEFFKTPFIVPVIWWIDYYKNGEIGLYD